MFHIIDFGLAVNVNGSAVFTSHLVGTPTCAPRSHLKSTNLDVLSYSAETDLESLVKTWTLLVLSREAKYEC